MRRRLLITLLALGTIGGYGSALAGISCRAHARRNALERHVAHICAEAAKNPNAAPQDDPFARW
ncbi:hypothetical protein A7982_12324 [Minicystis rosea]|nr:hypothetical protein A7982_12324 [Minicystis rosea]